MQTKRVKKDNFEDSKYCYVILRKGKRPTLSTENVSTNSDNPSLDVNNGGSIFKLYHKCRVHFQESRINFKLYSIDRSKD